MNAGSCPSLVSTQPVTRLKTQLLFLTEGSAHNQWRNIGRVFLGILGGLLLLGSHYRLLLWFFVALSRLTHNSTLGGHRRMQVSRECTLMCDQKPSSKKNNAERGRRGIFSDGVTISRGNGVAARHARMAREQPPAKGRCRPKPAAEPRCAPQRGPNRYQPWPPSGPAERLAPSFRSEGSH